MVVRVTTYIMLALSRHDLISLHRLIHLMALRHNDLRGWYYYYHSLNMKKLQNKKVK